MEATHGSVQAIAEGQVALSHRVEALERRIPVHLDTRLEALEVAVRQNSASITELQVDFRRMDTDVRRMDATLGRVEQKVMKTVERGEFDALAERVSALERA
jgi:hypothetical protein